MTLDDTPPLLSLSVPTNASTLSDTNVTFNWTANDTVATNLNCSLYINATYNQSAYGNGSFSVSVVLPEAANSWYVACADNATNTNTSETRNFTVAIPVTTTSSGGGGGGGGGGLTTLIELSPTEPPAQRTISGTGTYYFSTPGSSDSHSLRVKRFDADGVLFVIQSTPVEVFLKKGQSKEVDVTGDGVADVVVTLVSFSQYSATFTIAAVGAPEAAPEAAPEDVVAESAPEAEAEPAAPSLWWWVAGTVAILALVLLAWRSFGRR